MQRFDLGDNPFPLNSLLLHDAQQQRWLYFENPVEVLTATCPEAVMPLLETVQQRTAQAGLYAAGFVSYEAAPAFDPSFQVQPCPDFPLAWFGLYTPPQIVTLPVVTLQETMIPDWLPSISRSRYQTAIRQIKHHIARGDTYQVNFSLRLRSPFPFHPWFYFLQLAQAQSGAYGAFINLEKWVIASASPELFFDWRDRTVRCRPMKGTAPRGLTWAGDRQLARELQHSEKNRAENLMIVDMIRNDLGRIARLGSVQVPRLFDVEQYPTLWQMTSPVQCQTDAGFAEIFCALFPCASITGAPKTRTLQIIAGLEDSPRRIYTGAIGFLTPERTAQFNVAIRTVLIDKTQNTAEYGVGGGIVWDSVETSEFEECSTKAKILTQPPPTFELLESMLWQPDSGYFLLELHLQRLQQSAEYFGFAPEQRFHQSLEHRVQKKLEYLAQTLPAIPHKVRLRLDRQGNLQLTAEPLWMRDPMTPLKVGIAPTPVDSSCVFLYHKTTRREWYEQAKQSCPGWDDVLLWNERGELTESCIANLVVEWEGRWYTPPVDCGLLAGTLRSWLLKQGRLEERIIRLEDLQHCSRLFLINSVRQIQEAIAETRMIPVAKRQPPYGISVKVY